MVIKEEMFRWAEWTSRGGLNLILHLKIEFTELIRIIQIILLSKYRM